MLSCFSCDQPFATLWTVAHQAPLSKGFSSWEYWSGCHFLLQGIYPTQGSNLCLLRLLAGGFFITSATWEALDLECSGMVDLHFLSIDALAYTLVRAVLSLILSGLRICCIKKKKKDSCFAAFLLASHTITCTPCWERGALAVRNLWWVVICVAHRRRGPRRAVTTLTAVRMGWTWTRRGPPRGLRPCGQGAPLRSCPTEANPLMRSAATPSSRTFTRISCESWRWAGPTRRTSRRPRRRPSPAAGRSALWSNWTCSLRRNKGWCARLGGCSSNPSSPCRRKGSWNWWPGGNGSSTGWHLKVRGLHHPEGPRSSFLCSPLS